MSIEKESKKSETKKDISEKKIFIALKSVKITCNGVFELIKDEPIPEGIEEAFIESLINSNLIK